MCTIWVSKAHVFLGHFGPQISKNSGLWSLSKIIFTGFTSVLPNMLIASTFKCVENMGLSGSIFGPLWPPPQISKNSGLWSFSLLHQSWFTCQFGILLEVCWIFASETQFQDNFGHQNRTWFRSVVILSNISTGFTSFLCYMLIGVCLGVFQGILFSIKTYNL